MVRRGNISATLLNVFAMDTTRWRLGSESDHSVWYTFLGNNACRFNSLHKRWLIQEHFIAWRYDECGVCHYGPDRLLLDREGYEQAWSPKWPCKAQGRSVLKELPLQKITIQLDLARADGGKCLGKPLPHVPTNARTLNGLRTKHLGFPDVHRGRSCESSGEPGFRSDGCAL